MMLHILSENSFIQILLGLGGGRNRMHHISDGEKGGVFMRVDAEGTNGSDDILRSHQHATARIVEANLTHHPITIRA